MQWLCVVWESQCGDEGRLFGQTVHGKFSLLQHVLDGNVDGGEIERLGYGIRWSGKALKREKGE